MAGSASTPDGSCFLTWRERKILAGIAEGLSTSDPSLAEQLTDDDPAELVYTPPAWTVHVSRVGILMIPVVMVIPFELWSGLVILAIPVVAYKLLHGRTSGQRASGKGDRSP
jgi:hypothetical protein